MEHTPNLQTVNTIRFSKKKQRVSQLPPKVHYRTGATLEAIYTYRDGTCENLFFVYRFTDKSFLQGRPSGEPGKVFMDLDGVQTILFNLPALIADKTSTVWIVEGEKDVLNLQAAGGLATCNPSGAMKWHDEYSEVLRGRVCYVIPDNDPPEKGHPRGKGYAHALQVASSLYEVAAVVKIVEIPGLPVKGDVSDFLAAGGTVRQLDKMAEESPQWRPTHRIVRKDEDDPEDRFMRPIKRGHGDDKEWISCIHNARIWLADPRHQMTIRYDIFKQTILVNGEQWTDERLISLIATMEADTRTVWSENHVRGGVIEVASHNEFSSLQEWLNSLKWDGVKRIDHFFSDCFGSEQSEYTSMCARMFFVGMVARAYEPGCKLDTMPLLMGAQGIGKSNGMANLCPYRDWFSDDLGGDLHDKAAAESLRGKWMVEFAEFARINRVTNDIYKSFITRQVDHYRPPYGRTPKDFPRQCGFFGTTNNEHPLQDEENRRFMPINVIKADFDLIASNAALLWAEAVSLYRSGYSWWKLSSSLSGTVRERQELARSSDAWEDLLYARFQGEDEATLESVIDALKIDRSRFGKSEQIRVGLCFKKLGFERKRRREDGERAYFWKKKPADVDPLSSWSPRKVSMGPLTEVVDPIDPISTVPMCPHDIIEKSNRDSIGTPIEGYGQPGAFIGNLWGQRDMGTDDPKLTEAVCWLDSAVQSRLIAKQRIVELGKIMNFDPEILDQAAEVLKVSRTIENGVEFWSFIREKSD